MIFSWEPFGVDWNGQQTAWPVRGVPEWSEKMNPNDYKDSMRRSLLMKKRQGEGKIK